MPKEHLCAWGANFILWTPPTYGRDFEPMAEIFL